MIPAWNPRPSSWLRNMEKEEPEPRLRYPVEGQYQSIATAMTNAGIDAIYIQGTPFFPVRHIWKADKMEQWVAEHGIESREGEFYVPMEASIYDNLLRQQGLRQQGQRDLVDEADPEKLIGFDSEIDEIISFYSVQKIYVVKGGPADRYIHRIEEAED